MPVEHRCKTWSLVISLPMFMPGRLPIEKLQLSSEILTYLYPLCSCSVLWRLHAQNRAVSKKFGLGGRRTAWPKATARGRVREGDVPPPAQSAKAKFTFNS